MSNFITHWLPAILAALPGFLAWLASVANQKQIQELHDKHDELLQQLTRNARVN